MKIVAFEHWDDFYKEKTQGLDPYDHYDEGFYDALEMIDDWLDSYIPIDPVYAAGSCYCRECELRGREDCAMFYRCDCGEQHTWETDNDFCSYGRRREDADG